MVKIIIVLSLWALAEVTLGSEPTTATLPSRHPAMMSRLQVTIPVSWEISTSGFSRSRVASISESYAELWTYEQFSYGSSYLTSPRARVAVYAISGDGQLSRMPRLLVIGEQQLASLLGIEFRERSPAINRQIILDLAPSAEHENSVSFQPGREEIVNLIISFQH